MSKINLFLLSVFIFSFIACDLDDIEFPVLEDLTLEQQFIIKFGSKIDPNNLDNYANQEIPPYILKDNTVGNLITDEGATLGRILFYDRKLSKDNTISCASCHDQSQAFGDAADVSIGVAGVTGRHSMRLINTRFADESHFFWDERANTLEDQTTMPIQDHIEMGFSGTEGDEDINGLITKLSSLSYYQYFFTKVFGDPEVTEERMQKALAQFIRSIQSFDSKYDESRRLAPNDAVPFTGFTMEENMGKNLFLLPPQFDRSTGLRIGGGLGCQGCHRAPEFDIDPMSGNNGITVIAGDFSISDFTVTRAPTLRNVVKPSGGLNGNLMHNGFFNSLDLVLSHYNDIQAAGNPSLDPRLARNGGQQLNITPQEREAVIAFIATLGGADVYTNSKWSNPF